MVSTAPAPPNRRRLPHVLGAPGVIETSRLRLRRPAASDAPAVFTRYASDPAVTRFLGWRTHESLSDTQLFLFCCDETSRRPVLPSSAPVSRDWIKYGPTPV